MRRTPRPAPVRRARVRVEPLEDRTAPAFLAAPAFAAGPNAGDRSEPRAVVTADFNRDGKPDVATANFRAVGVSILLGTGTGGLKTGANVKLPQTPRSIITADVNGDGKLDLITVNHDVISQDGTNNGTISVLIGNGLGGFTLARTMPAGLAPHDVAAADFNGDGKVDLAVSNFTSSSDPGTITLLFGTGKGTFTAGGTLPVAIQTGAVAAGDFNGDGHPDLASVSSSPDRLTIYMNNGDGTFFGGNVYPTGGSPGTLAVGDFNHDQVADVAVGCQSNSGVSILLGNVDVSGKGDGTFGAFTNFPVYGSGVPDLVVADMNGDGYPDLVSANGQGPNYVSVMLANSNGSFGFGPAALFTANQSPQGVAVGDFNGDGRPDVAAAGMEFLVGAGTENGCVDVLLGNGDGTLAASRQMHVGINPTATVVADFTGDGTPDVAVAFNDVQFSGASIFPGLGAGAFGEGLRTVPVGGPTGLATADFNGDGKPDLAVGTNTGVNIALGNGDAGGTFATPVAYTTGLTTNKQVRWVATALVNSDLIPDVLLATDSGVSVFLGNGDGTLGTAQNTPVQDASYVATGDFNADGKTDLAVVSYLHSQLDVLFGTGTGTFGTPTVYTTDGHAVSVVVGDFNGDHKPDLAVSVNQYLGLAIYLAGPGGKFAPKGTYHTGGQSTGMVVADFNGDGKPDIATIDQHGQEVYVFPGTGLGTFGTPAMYIVGSRPMFGAAADFNADGRPDLAVSNFGSATLSILDSPNPVAGFRVTTTGPVTAGKPVGVTVTAVDAAGHLVPSFTGSVKLTSTDPKAVLPLAYTFTATAYGSHKFTVTPKTAGNQDIVAHFGTTVTGIGTVQVTAAAATHLVVSAPATATAGTPFDLVVTAADPFGNPDPAFRGAVHFATTGTSAGVSLPPDYTFDGTDAGRHTFAGGVTLLKAGARTVSATALGVHWVTPKAAAPVKVSAGALSRFLVSLFPAAVGAGTAHTFTVTAQDAYGNTVTNYTGTVTFSSSDPAAVLPPAYTFVAGNLGKHGFSARLLTPGTGVSLTVDDGSVTGTVTGITVT